MKKLEKEIIQEAYDKAKFEDKVLFNHGLSLLQVNFHTQAIISFLLICFSFFMLFFSSLFGFGLLTFFCFLVLIIFFLILFSEIKDKQKLEEQIIKKYLFKNKKW